jgi:hypothetical protein
MNEYIDVKNSLMNTTNSSSDRNEDLNKSKAIELAKRKSELEKIL